MTTIPAGIDSHPDWSDIKGNQILSTGFCESGQRREPPAQGRISQSAWEPRLIGTVLGSAFWNSVEQEQCDLRDNRAIQRRDTGGESHRSRVADEIGSSKIGQRVVSQAAWIALPKLRYLEDTQSEYFPSGLSVAITVFQYSLPSFVERIHPAAAENRHCQKVKAGRASVFQPTLRMAGFP
jgi:hypothetical protein